MTRSVSKIIGRRGAWFLPFLCALFLAGAPVFGETFMGRQYELFDGRKDRGQAAPIIVAMHGFLGTPASMRSKTQFNALATKNGLIVVYPKGKRRKWNDGRNPRNRVDDAGFLSGLLTAMIGDGRVDPRRVFLTGHSNGGGMAMRMACEHPGLIAGISVVATKTPVNFQCRNGPPVPAIFFHGTVDPISPHGGRNEGSRLGESLSSADTIALWAKRNRCGNARRTKNVDRKDDGTSAEIIQFTSCAAPLVYVEMEGHGHDWPRTNGKASRLQGSSSQELSATSLTWWFFENL